MRQTRIAITMFLVTGSVPRFRREDGQTLTEYALILSLIAVVVIGTVIALGGKIKGIFSSVTSSL